MKKKQFAIIGLGNFGFYLATRLAEKGHDVLAVDKSTKLVQKIRDHVSRSVIADATDIVALKELGLDAVDAVVVCIGSNLNNSILTTLNIKDLGVKKVVAKAVTDTQGRILLKIGADEVYFPEKDLAFAAAQRLENPNVVDYIPFMEGYGIVQFAPPVHFIGKQLKELDLINRHGVQVVAIKQMVPEEVVMIPTGGFVVKKNDILFLLGHEDAVKQLEEAAP